MSKKTIGFSPVDSAIVVAVLMAAGSLVAARLDDVRRSYTISDWDTGHVTTIHSGVQGRTGRPKEGSQDCSGSERRRGAEAGESLKSGCKRSRTTQTGV
jgi:hypothetical protein